MKYITYNGTRFAYQEKVGGNRSILFIHGWTCDHSHFSSQIEAFGDTHRVIAVDLRGHGKSGKPCVEYTLNTFASDIAGICRTLELDRPLLVGHSMGGAVALETAVRYPNLTSGIILIDTLLLPDDKILATLREMYDNLLVRDFYVAMDSIALLLGLPSSDQGRCQAILQGMKSTPREVAISAFEHHIFNFDAAALIARCHVPSGYIRSCSFMANLDRLKDIWPGLVTGETLGSGHFSMIEVPEQINAMLRRFYSMLWNEDTLKGQREMRVPLESGLQSAAYCPLDSK